MCPNFKVYSARHQKAEEEEQRLWDKWQTLRTEAGKQLRGRSKSRDWREVKLPARLRTGRVSSLQSEDSFSGRLSPRSGNLEEIIVSTAPPTPQPEDISDLFVASNTTVHLDDRNFCDFYPIYGRR